MLRNLLKALGLSLAFSVLGMALVFWLGGLRLSQLAQLRELPLTALLAALTALLASLILAALRLQLLCRRFGLRLHFAHALRTHVLGVFSAAATPGGSGSAPAIALSLNHHGLSGSQAWATAIVLFVADALFLSWSLPIALIILRRLELYPTTLLANLLALLAVGVTALATFVLTYKLEWLTPFFRLITRGPLVRLRRNLLRFADSLLDSSRVFRGAGWRHHVLVQIWTALSWFAYFSVLVFAAWGLGIPVNFVAAQAWQLAVTTLSFAVPTPGGSGFFEFGTSVLLLGKGNDEVVPAALLVYRSLTYYLFFLLGPLLGGFVFLEHLQTRAESDEG